MKSYNVDKAWIRACSCISNTTYAKYLHLLMQLLRLDVHLTRYHYWGLVQPLFPPNFLFYNQFSKHHCSISHPVTAKFQRTTFQWNHLFINSRICLLYLSLELRRMYWRKVSLKGQNNKILKNILHMAAWEFSYRPSKFLSSYTCVSSY